jgi:hypothetical protein
MAFNITSEVTIERDTAGAVRSLQHLAQAYQPEGVLAQNATAVASAYVRDVATIYGFDPSMLGALDSPPSETIIDETARLQIVGSQGGLGTTIVSYQQTYFGVPVWEAGFSVTLLTNPPRVVGSQATTHATVEVRKPAGNARFMPERLTVELLRRLLPEKAPKRGLVINGKRLWIYRYDAKRRVRSDGQPTLPLPVLPRQIHDGRHYVATEVLFTLALPGWRDLNWQALIETETGAILYLRALVEACTGSVYLTDPPTATGDATITACSSAATLDGLRTDATLDDLTSASPQALTGTYVTIVDDSTPAKPPPTVMPPPCDFTYSVVSTNFAAVCAYYHVDELFRLVVSFGYNPISTFFSGTTFPLPVYYFDENDVNSHAFPNATNTGFGKITQGYVQQRPDGTFCPVGMAADWRVTMHEFVHGMLDDRIHSGVLGFAHNGGDAFGAIYMDPASKAPDRFLTFPWVPAVPRRFDRSVALGWAWGGTQDDGNYQSEEILATTLFRIYRSTGGDSAYLSNRQFGSQYILYVMTHAMASLPLATTTPTTAVSYAAALMTADASAPAFNGVPGGTVSKVVRWSFEKQGLYQPAGAPTPVTRPGTPPDIDVYVNDQYYGEYTYTEVFWENTNIWNLLAPNPFTSPADHQTPIVGVTNYAYVLISNRGTKPASNITVSGYHCRPSAGLLWPDDWQAMTTASINVAGPLEPGSSTLVGPFQWTPSEIGHECMLMVVSTSGDLSNADAASGLPCATGPTPHWRLVPFDNNIGQRNVAPVAGGGGASGLAASLEARRFWFNNPYDKPERARIEVTLPKFLAERGWSVEFSNVGGSSFVLGPRAHREIIFRLAGGGDFSPADVQRAGMDTVIVAKAFAGDVLVGGMSYAIDPVLKTPPRETPVHKADRCADEAKKLLECLDIRVDDVRSVRVKRITVEIDLKNDC